MTTALLVAVLLGQEPKLPSFSLSGTDGKTYTKAVIEAKTTLIVFLAKGCPHNKKAVADLNRMSKSVGADRRFLGVVNADMAATRALAKDLKFSFPLVADPGKTLTRAFEATHSLDIGLICSHDKLIAGLWNGYSRAYVQEIWRELPMHGGSKVAIDASAFPVARQSGCSL